MVVHHDKMGYGKLSDLSVEFSDEKLLEMVAEINAQTEESAPDKDADPASTGTKKRDPEKK